MVVGCYLVFLYGRKTKKFLWREYIALVVVPVGASLGLAFEYGVKIIYLYVSSSILGFILEYLLGLFYHKTLNRRLWKYDKYSLQGYTSYLTIPLWGVAGVEFWLLGKKLGL